jgi:segregation and condensation protein B
VENVKAIIEALVFVSETPLSADRIRDVLGDVERCEVVRLLSEIARDCEERNAGINLREVAGGFQFRTREDAGPWVKKLIGIKPSPLSQAAMETLAVVAYRQPVVKADVDRVRGVDTSGPLRSLLEKKLVRIVGRKDVPGKPIIYGTTKKFLEVFNLKDLTELPTLRELKDLQE